MLAQGPYVLVLVARGAQGTGPEDERRSRLPAMWLIKAYTRLTRPYKKNVKYIILERPSTLMSSMIVLLRPFTSLKAARKLRQVLKGS